MSLFSRNTSASLKQMGFAAMIGLASLFHSAVSSAAVPHFAGATSLHVKLPSGAESIRKGLIQEENIFVAPMNRSFHRINYLLTDSGQSQVILSLYYDGTGVYMFYGDMGQPTTAEKFAKGSWPVNEKTWIKLADQDQVVLKGTFYPWSIDSRTVKIEFNADFTRIVSETWQQNGLVIGIPKKAAKEFIFRRNGL